MKFGSGSLLRVAVGVVLLAAAPAFAQTPPAEDASAPVATPPPPAAEPVPAPEPPPPAAAPAQLDVVKAADDNDDDDDDGNKREPPRDDVMGVSPQASGFDGDAWGDEGSTMHAGPLTFRLALQTRYRETFATPSGDMRLGVPLREMVLAEEDDGFKLQRFLMRMSVTPKPWLSFKGTLDFAKLRGSDVSDVVKQAIATLRPVEKRVEIYTGVFKIPYSILELDPVAQYELTDFGDSNELINDMGFAGRDVGVAVMLAPLPKPKWARLVIGTWRGHARDENSSPLGVFAARLESKPWMKGLRFGASMVVMPQAQSYKQPFETSSKDVLPNPPDRMYPRELRWDSGKAYSADISYTRKRISIRVEGLLGDRVDVDQRYNARSYGAIWALVAYRFKVGKIGVMPAARVEFFDADLEHAVGGRRQLSFALNFLYKRSVRFVLDVAHTEVQDQTTVLEQPQPLPGYPYFALDNTRITGQLQLEL
jgi:hypothetical protein